MKSFEGIVHQLRLGQFDFSEHAFRRVVERNISLDEIVEAAENVRIIEYYPEDKYAASYLLLGFTHASRPIHIQVSTIDSDNVRIITIYEPDQKEWIDSSQRKK